MQAWVNMKNIEMTTVGNILTKKMDPRRVFDKSAVASPRLLQNRNNPVSAGSMKR